MRNRYIYAFLFAFVLLIIGPIKVSYADSNTSGDSDLSMDPLPLISKSLSNDHLIKDAHSNAMQSIDKSLRDSDVIKKENNNIKQNQAKLRSNSEENDSKLMNQSEPSTSVYDWPSFVAAVTDSNIKNIDIRASFSALNNGALFSGDKIINFNGYSLNMNGHTLNLLNNSVQFNNASINKREGSGIVLMTSLKDCTFSGDTQINGKLFNVATGGITPTVNFVNANVSVNNSNNNENFINMEGLNSGTINIINSKMTDSTYNFIRLTGSKKYINIKNSTIDSLYTTGRQGYICHFIDSLEGSGAGIELTIDEKSKVTINKPNSEITNGVIKISGPNSKINLSDSSSLDVENPDGTGVFETGLGSEFNVSGDKTVLKVTRGPRGTLNPAFGSPIRFFLTGSMTFNISDKAKVNVFQNGALNTYGIRMFGGNNRIFVRSGAEFNCINNSSSGNAAFGDSGGQGIYYAGGDLTSPTNVFSLEGNNSQVLINANNGPAIDSNTDIAINAGNNTNFIARGFFKTDAIFNAGSRKLAFTMDSPRYFDFMNTAATGQNRSGATLFKNGPKSSFTHDKIPLSVWLFYTNVKGSPTASWNHVSATYSDTDFKKYTTDTPENGFKEFLDKNQGLSSLGRMTANTSPAQVKNAPLTPNDADKYVWVPSLMPEENDAYRPAYDDEVYATVQLTYPDRTVKTATGSSKQHLSYYEYNSGATIDGAIRIPVSSFVPDKTYLEAGTKVKVTKVWRGDPNPDSPAAIVSTADDNKYSEQTVVRGTVPAPAQIKGGLTISQWATELEGTGEPGANVSWEVIHEDGRPTDNHPKVTTVDANGNWKINNISNIVNKDKIRITLGITVDGGKVLSNPIDETVFHDKTFKPATVIEVGGTNALTLDVPKELDFGVIPAYRIGTIKPISKTYDVKVNDDRNPLRGNWTLSAKASNFRPEGSESDVSNSQLSLGVVDSKDHYENISGDSDIILRTQQASDPLRGTTVIDYINGPQQLRLKANGVSTTGKYTSTLSWTAIDSL